MISPDDVSQLPLVERYILAVLGAQDEEAVPEELWLQKALFLLSKMNARLAEEAGFEPYLQGPWSEEVRNALEDLESLGFAQSRSGHKRIHLSDVGEDVHQYLEENMPAEIREQVEDVKELINDMTEEELLVFLYFTHPEMTEESVKVRKAVQHRQQAAKSLYDKGKVSLEKAAELAGMRISEFRTEVASEAA